MQKTIRRTIAKNASVLFIAQMITWVMSLLLTIFLTRYLGAEPIGQYQLASSLWSIMIILTSMGMDTLLTKEISRAPERTGELFYTSLILRSLFFFLGFGALYLYGRLARYPMDTLYVLYIVGAANFFVLLASGCQAALQGLERMEFISLSDILSKTFITFISITILLLGRGVIIVALVFVVGAIISFSYQFNALRKIKDMKWQVNPKLMGWMVKTSIPYLLIIGIRTIYSQLDVVIISLMTSVVVIGWYGAAYRLFATLLFIPAVFNSAVFPAMARMHASSPERLPIMFRKSSHLMLLLGVPVGFGTFLVANNLVVLLFGVEFINSGPVLALMGLVLVMTYLNALIGQFLISTDRQKQFTYVMAGAMLATIPLDVVLIPWCQYNFANGAIGGSLSYLITEAGILVGGCLMLPKGILTRTTVSNAIRILLAGGLMAAATWSVRNYFILIPVAVGIATYGAAILIIKVVPREDWDLVKSLGGSYLGRLRRKPSDASVIGG
jgi:O-antigen/teichoic acid export membrane protein